MMLHAAALAFFALAGLYAAGLIGWSIYSNRAAILRALNLRSF